MGNLIRTAKMPAKTCAARIEWANDYLWDYAERKIDREDLRFVWATLIGWRDFATGDEVRSYDAMIRRISETLEGR